MAEYEKGSSDLTQWTIRGSIVKKQALDDDSQGANLFI